tara:strand:- start:3963 stop:4544 length:582 start_codon:yes stop_codon:yes gene_type:complete
LKKVGLLGGSFDPPHKGHIYISLEAKKILKLDEIWWLITPKNPLKILEPASYNERLKNCKKITLNKPIKIKQIEKKINSKCSYQTIKFINNFYEHIDFVWLMGADNLINMHKWEKWRKIFSYMPIVVFRRHGYNNKAINSKVSKVFKNKQVNQNFLKKNNFSQLPLWSFITNKEIRISSTEIRKQRNNLRGKN